MQTVIVVIVLTLCGIYALWRCYCIVFRKTDPCDGCTGCSQKSERRGVCECHCPQGHGMLNDEPTCMKKKSCCALP